MEGRATPNIELNSMASFELNNAYLQPTPGLAGGSPQWLNTWATRIFVMIVLQCTALFLLSQFPGFQSPFWLGIALQGYTYGSAFLFYASGGDERQ